MTPNHDQLSDAVSRHLTRIDAKIEAAKAESAKLKARESLIVPLVKNKGAQEQIVLVGFPVHDVDDYKYSEFSIEEGWDHDERARGTTVSFVATHVRSARRMHVKLPIRNPGSHLASSIEKGIANEKAKLAKAKAEACSRVEILSELRKPQALNSFRSYLRAQWAPRSATVMLTQLQLNDLSESFLATRNASSCEIG